MDQDAQYRINPPHVVFEFAAGGQSHVGRVSIDALSAMAGAEVFSPEQALEVYQRRWREIHSAALGLRARGEAVPFIRRADVE